MLTATDLTERLGVTLEVVATLHARRILPEPIRVGGECRWRVEDVELFVDYLRERNDCRNCGIDPDGPNGPAVPIYSTGLPRTDPRNIVQQQQEKRRQRKSRTLRAGSRVIVAEAVPILPELPSTIKVEGK